MRYLRAYAKAWWNLWCYMCVGNLAAAVLLYVFTESRLSPLVLFYSVYLVSLAAVGGVVRELLGDKS